ncbi:MAG: DUF421 domain-containing protein [Coprobacillus sp.]
MKYSELIIECFAVYFYLVIVLRFLGKKEMSKLSILDLIVFLIISELMTLSIGNEETTFVYSAIGTFVIILIDKICSYVSLHFRPIKKLLEGHQTYIIYQGQVKQDIMKKLNYTISDLCHHLREQGIGSISDIEFAVLETDGNLSVIQKQDSHYMIPDPIISDGEINYDILKIINKDENWVKKKLQKEQLILQDIFYCIVEDEELFYIKK